MITYSESITHITPEKLAGFFIGWPNPPSPETHLRILKGSSYVVLALDGEQVVGFITAVTDGVLTAYIPLLEVLPAYKAQGIGTQLVQRMLERLRNLYMVDLTCDSNLQPFYERFGMRPYSGMIMRNYDRQSGE